MVVDTWDEVNVVTIMAGREAAIAVGANGRIR